MGEAVWQSMKDAPIGRPVRVWASYGPSDPLMSWRTFVGIQKHRGWWYVYGARNLIYPTHWCEVAPPPEPGQPMREPDA